MIIPKEEMLKAYHYDLIEHARTARLIKEANKNKPGLHSQFLCKAGDGLIALGLRLRHMSHLPEEANRLVNQEGREVTRSSRNKSFMIHP